MNPNLYWMKQPYNWRYWFSSEISYTSPGIIAVLTRIVCSQNRVEIQIEECEEKFSQWHLTRPTRKGKSSYHFTFPLHAFPCHQLKSHCQQERERGWSQAEGGEERVLETKEKVPNRDNRSRSPRSQIPNLNIVELKAHSDTNLLKLVLGSIPVVSSDTNC